MSRWATRRRGTAGMDRAAQAVDMYSIAATRCRINERCLLGASDTLRAYRAALGVVVGASPSHRRCYARPHPRASGLFIDTETGLSMSTGTVIRLASADDALSIARMSRDLIEHGLGWSWTPL